MRVTMLLVPALFAAAAAAPLAVQAPIAVQAPLISSRVDAVRVDVLVTDRGRVVKGLQAEDFEILDDGVPQQVELVTFDRIPLSVILTLDSSDSVAGERLANLRAAGLALLDRLEAPDEAALLTFNHALFLGAPLSRERGAVRAALGGTEGSGRTALVDASQAALVLGAHASGRALAIVFSDGVDTASLLPVDAPLDTARRSDVVVYGVWTGGRGRPAFLGELARLTGGSLLSVDSTSEVGPAFLRILQEFRERYLLSYTPSGVSRSGWHQLEVRVKGRRATVRARPGYLAGG